MIISYFSWLLWVRNWGKAQLSSSHLWLPHMSAMRSQLGMPLPQGYTRLEDAFSKWLTHLARKAVLALSQQPHLLSAWTPNGMITGSTRAKDPRDQGRDHTSEVTHWVVQLVRAPSQYSKVSGSVPSQGSYKNQMNALARWLS